MSTNALTILAYIENCVTVLGIVAIVLGLYWMHAGWFSLVGFLLLLNMNTVKVEAKCQK